MPTSNTANANPVTPPRGATTPATQGDPEVESAPPQVEVAHTPVFHTIDSLPAPLGNVPKVLHTAGYATLRSQAKDLFDFLWQTDPPLLKLNESTIPYVALVNIPRTCKVKVVFCPGFGSSPIGAASKPTDGRLLCLHGDGNQEWGPPQPLIFPVSSLEAYDVPMMTEEEFVQAISAKGSAFSYPLLPDTQVSTTTNIMKVAPIPAYFVYDGIRGDLHAGLVYERIMKHSAEETPMMEHLKAFLRGCLSGQIKANPKPYMSSTIFSAPAPGEARAWAKATFANCFPSLCAPALVPPPTFRPAGVSPEIQALLTSLAATVTPASSPSSSPTKTDEGKTSMSASELQSTLVMCGQASSGTMEDLPRWFQDCASKGTTEQYQLTIIRKWVMTHVYYDDADIPLTTALLKGIRKRAWAGKDGNITRPSLVNAMDGLSPFTMMDMDEDVVAAYNDEDALLDAASLVSVADLRAMRKKFKAVVPAEAEDFLLLLKRFGNLLFALFSEHCPLFRSVQEVIRAFKAYSREARRQMSQASKGSILWIILLQSRQFALGEVNILFEFTKMHEDLRAKKCCFHHSEVPMDLVTVPVDKGKQLSGGGDPAKKRRVSNPNTWHPKLKEAMLPAIRKAGNPTFTQLLGFLKMDASHIVARGSDECAPNTIMGACNYGDACRRKHRIASDRQVTQILEFVQPFLKHPEALRKGK